MGDAIETKRVYDDRTGARTVVVAAARGLAVARVSGDRVGRVGLLEPCAPRAVAADAGRVAAATAEDVVLATGTREAGFEPTGFGPAVAVGFHEGPLAAGPEGRVARYADGDWTTLGTVGSVAAIDGDLIATDAGLHRVTAGLPHVGLDAVRDVAASGQPLAATAEGLYALANGWERRLDGDFRMVAAAPGGDPAHAATRETLYARAEAWTSLEFPVEGRIADVAYPDAPCIATAEGTLVIPGPDGWRPYPIGLDGIVGLAATENGFEPPA